MTLTDFERRWIADILPAFLGDEGPLAGADAEVDYVSAVEAMARGAGPRAVLGIHVALLLVTAAPAWMHLRAQTFGEMPMALRTATLDRMLAHRLYLVRGLATLLKLAASLAMMASPALRAQTHYTRRRALPVVTAEAA